jgi:hypothetical protein
MNAEQKHRLRELRLALIKAIPVERELARRRDEQRRGVVELSAVATVVPAPEMLAELAAKDAELRRTLADWQTVHAQMTHLQTAVRALERAAEEQAG